MRQILNLSQWETRVADVHSMARLCRMTSAELQDRVKAQIWDELNRKHGKRAVYSAYVHGYVSGLLAAERSRLYREFLEYCYSVEGVLYSTHKDSVHRKTEEFYARDAGHVLSECKTHGHYWKGTDKPFFLG